jgi:WD40 repeat protein/tRNA A-37 threonylcarbamoyl transferase component Bud32/tetratricopeptide (TPR) repeat protein
VPPTVLICPDRGCGVIVQMGQAQPSLACPRCRKPLGPLPRGAGIAPPAGAAPPVVLRCGAAGCGVIVRAALANGEQLPCPRCRAPLGAVPLPVNPPRPTLDLPAATPAPSSQPAVTRELPVPGAATPAQTPPLSVQPPANTPPPSRIGRFEVRRFLGEGGFGRVYEAYDPSLKRQVALKLLRPEQMQTQERIQRFLAEARSSAKLMHPHIVAVFDSGQDAGHHYIASAYVPGQPLGHSLQSGRRFSPREAAQIVQKLAEALAYAHREGIIHRDVKPGNVMLRPDGEPMLMDFGLAVRIEPGEERLTQGRALLGTPAYIAPEQCRGEPAPASDQYSLGITLFELMTGELPFSGGSPAQLLVLHELQPPPSPRQFRPDLPRDLEAICLKCLEKDPAKRYPTCAEVADDLKRFLDGEPVKARLPGPAERLMKWARRSPAVATLTASIALLVLASAAGAAVAVSKVMRSANEARDSAREADQARGKALEALKDKEAALEKAESGARELRKQQATENANKAWRQLDSGDDPGAMLWLAKAVELSAGDKQRERRNRLGLECLLRQYPLEHVWFDVRSAELSPNGKRIATGNDKGPVRVFEAATGEPSSPPMRHDGAVLRVSFSPDGKRLLTGSMDQTARIWNAATGTPIHRLKHSAPVYFAAFDPSGERVTTVTRDETVCVWHAASGKPITASRKVGKVLAISRTGKYVLVQSAGDRVELWESDKERVVATMPGTMVAHQAAIAGDSRRVILAHRVPLSAVPTAVPGDEVLRPKEDLEEVSLKAKEPEKPEKSERRGVWKWEGQSDSPPTPIAGTEDVLAVCFAPDGSRYAIGSRYGVDLIDWSPKPEQQPRRLYVGEVASLAFSGNGRRLAFMSLWRERRYPGLGGAGGAGCYGGGMQPGGFIGGGVPLPAPAAKGPAAPIIAPTAEITRYSSMVLDALTGERLTSPLFHCDARQETRLALTDDGSRLLSLTGSRSGGEVRVWRVAQAESMAVNLTTAAPPEEVWFSSDGKHVVARLKGRPGFSGWTTTDGKPVPARLVAPAGAANYTVQVPVMRRVKRRVQELTDKGETQVIELAVTETASMSVVKQGYGARRGVNRPAGEAPSLQLPGKGTVLGVTASGTLLVSVEQDFPGPYSESYVRIWDTKTARPLTAPLRHSLPVLGFAFSDDGEFFATWTIIDFRVWQARTGEPITPPLRLPDVQEAIFSPDNTRLVTISAPLPVDTDKPPSGEPRRYLHLWPLLPESDVADEVLALRCQVAACRGIDATGNIDSFTIPRLRESWEAYLLRARSRDTFAGKDRYTAWLSERAEACAAARLWPAAKHYLDALASSSPDDSSLHRRRGDVLAETGQWEAARRDFDKAVKRNPADPAAAFPGAALDVQSGNIDRYRERCADLVKQFGATRDPAIALGLVRVCLLAPDALGDYAPLLALRKNGALRGAKSGPEETVFGLLLYRAGRWREAEEHLSSMLGEENYTPSLGRIALALALMKRKESTRAAQQYVRCIDWFTRLADLSSRESGEELPWLDRLLHQRIFAEAKALIGPVAEADRERFFPGPLPAPKGDRIDKDRRSSERRDRLSHGTDVGIAILLAPRQRPADGRRQPGRHIGPARGQRDRFFEKNLAEQFRSRPRFIDVLARQQKIQRCRRRVLVGGRLDAAEVGHLFGRDEEGSARRHAGHRHAAERRFLIRPGQAEVGHLHQLLAGRSVDEKIGRLHVAMHEPRPMGVIQPHQRLEHQPHRPADGQRPLGLDQPGPIDSRHVFHHEPGQRPGDARAVIGDHVGVPQPLQDRCLAQKAQHQGRIRGVGVADDLDGDLAAVRLANGPVDGPHRAGAELGEESKTANRGQVGRRRRGRRRFAFSGRPDVGQIQRWPVGLAAQRHLQDGQPAADLVAVLQVRRLHARLVDIGAVAAVQVGEAAVRRVDLDQAMHSREVIVVGQREVRFGGAADEETLVPVEGEPTAKLGTGDDGQGDGHGGIRLLAIHFFLFTFYFLPPPAAHLRGWRVRRPSAVAGPARTASPPPSALAGRGR